MNKKREQQGTMEISLSDLEAVNATKAQAKPDSDPTDAPKSPIDDRAGEADEADEDLPGEVSEGSAGIESALVGRDRGGRRITDDPFTRTIIDERYEVLRCLGTGAMGSVFLVNHLRLSKLFALKMVKPELAGRNEFIARFKREADSCSRLEHPNCINVTDFGQTRDGSLYLVMEYADGELLSDLLADGPLSLEVAVSYVRQILQGLKHAHREGLIHRDIKLENLIICNLDSGDPLIKILDFGMARPKVDEKAEQRLTKDGVVMGTPQYMAPEQIRDVDVDHRADLYAVGITLIRLLTAKSVFRSNNVMEVFRQKLNDPPPTLKDVSEKTYPEAVEAFVAKAIAKKPSDRFADADEMLSALEQLTLELEGKGRSSLIASLSGTSLAPVAKQVKTTVKSTTNGFVQAVLDWYGCRKSLAPSSWKCRLNTLLTTGEGRVVLSAGVGGIGVLVLLGVLIFGSNGAPKQASNHESAGIVQTENPSPKMNPKAPAEKQTPKEHITGKPEKTASIDSASVQPNPAENPKIQAADTHPVLIEAAVDLGKRRCRAAEKKILASDVKNTARGLYLLGKIQACRGKRAKALDYYRQAIAEDDTYRADSGILKDAKKMMSNANVREEALKFMAEDLGKAALPTLIQLAGHHIVPDVRRRAQELVAQAGASEHVDMDAALDLDLNQAKTCKEKKVIVKKLAALNTKRARQALIRARDMTVKEGFFRTKPRHPCARPFIISTLKEMRKE